MEVGLCAKIPSRSDINFEGHLMNEIERRALSAEAD